MQQDTQIFAQRRARRAKRALIFAGFAVLSVVAHVALTSEAGRRFELVLNGAQKARPLEVEVVLNTPLPEEDPEPELQFDEPIEFETPETLVPVTAATPPPPDVDLAYRAAAGGGGGLGPTALPLDSITGAGAGTAGFGKGVGMGLNRSANQFAAYVQGLRETGLEVIFVLDTTGSMDWAISEVRHRIGDIVDAVRSLVPVSRFGIVAYRDLEGPEYTTRVMPLTFSLSRLNLFLAHLKAEGGGTYNEAVDEGIRAAISEGGWHLGAVRVIIVIGDAPPNRGTEKATQAMAREFQQEGGRVSTLDVSDDANPALLEMKLGRKLNRAFYSGESMLQFQQIAEAGGGIAATLDGEIRITVQLATLIFGGDFSREVALLMEGWQ